MRSILAKSHSLLHKGHTDRVRSQRWIQSRWKTCPQFPNAIERPLSLVGDGFAWYSIDGSLRELRQIAHVSAHISQDHMATAFHFLISKRGGANAFDVFFLGCQRRNGKHKKQRQKLKRGHCQVIYQSWEKTTYTKTVQIRREDKPVAQGQKSSCCWISHNAGRALTSDAAASDISTSFGGSWVALGSLLIVCLLKLSANVWCLRRERFNQQQSILSIL